jgi:hypothetical protein
MIFVFIGELTNWPNKMFPETRKICKYGVSQKWRTNYLLSYRGSLNVHEKNVSDKKSIIFITIPPPPGGTAILPEYIHYYGYYYQVIVQCLST